MKKKKAETPWDASLQGASDIERINAVWPEHDRTSCDDSDLYNAGTIFQRYRCERCEALSQLQAKELRGKS